MSNNIDLTKLKLVFPKDNLTREFKPRGGLLPKSEIGLYSGEKISIFNSDSICPYLVVRYDNETMETTHIDSILHPVTEEIAIEIFKTRFR